MGGGHLSLARWLFLIFAIMAGLYVIQQYQYGKADAVYLEGVTNGPF